MADSALEGIRVVELTHAIAGPHCGQILADHGADVIKVEPPSGERTRGALPVVDGESLYFACHNRGKRSIVLDLKSPDGTAHLHELVRRADVLLTNYSADVPQRLGWGYERVREMNPGIVMVHITGFGSTGPDRGLLAYDGIIQAMSGVAELTGTQESGPVFVGAFVADHIAAYQAALGAMFALHRRARTGEGAFVDISMLDAYSGTLAHEIGEALAGRPHVRAGNGVPTAFANTFPTTDGHIYLAPLGEDRWQAFCRAIGQLGWIGELTYDDAISRRREEAEKHVAEWCASRSRTDITELMRAAGVPCGPVWSAEERARHAADSGRGAISEVRSPAGRALTVPGPVSAVGLTISPRRAWVPALGEHTAEVLAELRTACPPEEGTSR
ncbi:CaiB/BaiF CoA transferase family protein [Pseudonocardia nigra]|uniref:CaiB/BaiF CoA transferase family protein n=1 Tax=Pseudonocardia nigra TaxID=1921578 RepID=UPI001C5DCC0F|nr:CoA transferase [Pseudonocardia nigra]